MYIITTIVSIFIYVLYSMPAAGKLSVGDSVPAAAKLA